MTTQDKPIFTIVIDVYFKLHLFKLSIESIQKQTYKNLEIIVVNNGADQEITHYINLLSKNDSRIKILHYPKNLYDKDNPALAWEIMLNEALFNLSTGEYFFYQSYDDKLAEDYIERMVNLFLENEQCITAAGRSVSMDILGRPNKSELNEVESVSRNIYMNGSEFILGLLSKNGEAFSSPGGATLFSYRRKDLIDYGGYDRCTDESHLYGIIPFGITGYDREAIQFWRRHEDQLNKEWTKRGYTSATETFDMLENSKIKERWDEFFPEQTNFVMESIRKSQYLTSANWFAINLCRFNFRGSLFTIWELGFRPRFWALLPNQIWKNKKWVLLTIAYFMEPLISKLIIFLENNLSFPKERIPGIRKLNNLYKNFDSNFLEKHKDP